MLREPLLLLFLLFRFKIPRPVQSTSSHELFIFAKRWSLLASILTRQPPSYIGSLSGISRLRTGYACTYTMCHASSQGHGQEDHKKVKACSHPPPPPLSRIPSRKWTIASLEETKKLAKPAYPSPTYTRPKWCIYCEDGCILKQSRMGYRANNLVSGKGLPSDATGLLSRVSSVCLRAVTGLTETVTVETEQSGKKSHYRKYGG